MEWVLLILFYNSCHDKFLFDAFVYPSKFFDLCGAMDTRKMNDFFFVIISFERPYFSNKKLLCTFF